MGGTQEGQMAKAQESQGLGMQALENQGGRE